MPEYKVEIERTQIALGYVYVKADDYQDARRMALGQTSIIDFSTYDSDYDIVDVSLEDE